MINSVTLFNFTIHFYSLCIVLGIIVLFVLSIICVGVGLVISYFYGQIDNLNKDKITYTSDIMPPP